MTAGEHTKEVEIRWSDLDGFAHVNHARFVTYFEEARDEWLDRATGSHGDALGFVIRRIEVDFVSPLLLSDDRVRVTVRLERVGTTSVSTIEEMHTAEEGRLVAGARCVMVYTGTAHERATPIPELLRGRFEAKA